MSRVRTYGSVIGTAVVPTASGASGVFDITTAAVETQANTWAGTVANPWPAVTSDNIIGMAVGAYNATTTVGLSNNIQMMKLTSDGRYYKLKLDTSATDRLIDVLGTVTASKGGLYIVYGVNQTTTNFRYIIYKKSTTEAKYTQISAINLAGTKTPSAHFNPDGTLLALTAGDGLHIYQRTGDTFTELSRPTGGPTSLTNVSVQWSWDGTKLALAGGGSSGALGPFVWSVSGTTLTPITVNIKKPTGSDNFIGWNRDSTKFLVSSGSTGYYYVGSPDGSQFSLASNISTMLPTSTYGPANLTNESWNRYGNVVVFGKTATPKIYSVTGNTFVNTGSFSSTSGFYTHSTIAFSSDEDVVVVNTGSSNLFNFYTGAGTTLTLAASRDNLDSWCDLIGTGGLTVLCFIYQ